MDLLLAIVVGVAVMPILAFLLELVVEILYQPKDHPH
jgi:hypothetical protein